MQICKVGAYSHLVSGVAYIVGRVYLAEPGTATTSAAPRRRACRPDIQERIIDSKQSLRKHSCVAADNQPGQHPLVQQQPSEVNPSGDDTALLIAALEHVRTWREARIERGLQVVNYFLVAIAVVATAYVSAINGKHYVIAAVVALAGMVLTAVAYAMGLGQRYAAAAAEPGLFAIQGRIADRLGIDAIQGFDKSGPGPVPRFNLAAIAFGLAGLLCIGAALYALIH